MRIKTGAIWGLITGVIIGLPMAAIAYLTMAALLDWLKVVVYQQAIAAGLDPNQAKQFAEIAASTSVVAAPLIALLISIVVFFIVGIIMALLWNRVKPWYALGLLFGIILVLINVVPQMPNDASQVELQELPELQELLKELPLPPSCLQSTR